MKFDLHMHSRFSPDSASCPKAILRRALQLGYGMISITDHDADAEAFDWLVSEGALSADGLLARDWAGRLGFPDATLRVLPGQEISTATGHLLCLAARVERSIGIDTATALEEIHRQGGLGIAAHPFDQWRAAFDPEELESLPFDAIEVFNGGASNVRVNQLANELARRRGLPGVANSDGHTISEIGRACGEIETQLPGETLRLNGVGIRIHTQAIEPRFRIAGSP